MWFNLVWFGLAVLGFELNNDYCCLKSVNLGATYFTAMEITYLFVVYKGESDVIVATKNV